MPANLTAGYFTPNFPWVSGALIDGALARVPVDLNRSSGAQPQSGQMVPGTLPAPPAQFGLTALAGGGKTGATALGYGVNRATTVATGADSLLLPYAYPGATAFLANDGAAAAQVFGKGTDTIDAVATGTGVALTNATRSWFIGIAGTGDGSDAGAWVSLKGSKAT